MVSLVNWGCKIHRQHLCREVNSSTNECPVYDSKPSDRVALVILELWEMWSTLSLYLLTGPFQLGMVAPDKVLSMDQTELYII